MVLYFLVGLFTLAVAILDSTPKIRNWSTLDNRDRTALMVGIVCYISIFILTAILYNKDLDEKTRLSRVGTFEINTNGLYVKYPSFKCGKDGIEFNTTKDNISFNSAWNNLFSIRAVKGKYNFIVYLREKDGDAIASINGTQFKIYHDGYDYNFDEEGFEIVTGDLKVVLQLDHREGTIWLAGLFYNEDGLVTYIPTEVPGISMELHKPEDNFIPPSDNIKRIFKYPRETYFQKRED